ncbi:hypothetical protein D1872_220510 [compost metagenome]
MRTDAVGVGMGSQEGDAGLFRQFGHLPKSFYRQMRHIEDDPQPVASFNEFHPVGREASSTGLQNTVGRPIAEIPRQPEKPHASFVAELQVMHIGFQTIRPFQREQRSKLPRSFHLIEVIRRE